MKRRFALGLVVASLVACEETTPPIEHVAGGAVRSASLQPACNVLFASDWSTGTGTGSTVVTDGGKWGTYDEFNHGDGTTLLSVVTAASVNAPATVSGNVLRTQQRGQTYAADVIKNNFATPSADYYVRFYMRNDDTTFQNAGDHAVEPGLDASYWDNLIYVRKYGSASGWHQTIGTEGPGEINPYPVNFWHLSSGLSLGVWYRFEYWIHFVDASHIQVHAKVYDANGGQLYGDADFVQSDPTASCPAPNCYMGRGDWTLASFDAAGYSEAVDPTKLVNFVLANNGQSGATDTGLYWYEADVAICSDTWVGSDALFASDWSTGTGTGSTVVTDGGKWDTYDEFNNGDGTTLLSVVTRASVNAPSTTTGNVLRTQQRGQTYAADIIKHNFITPSADYYLRFYMRTDDTTSAGDHAVEPGLDASYWDNLIYVRKSGSPSAWQEIIGTEGPNESNPYPVNFWHLSTPLSLGVWYRFEYWIHFVDASHIQVHAKVYDANGGQLYGDADFVQSDPTANCPAPNCYMGRGDWTLASFEAAGHSESVDPTKLVNFTLANNGQLGATDTGLYWYQANVTIRSDTWVGP